MSFHVVERARDTTHPILASSVEDGNNGAFFLDSVEPGWKLAIIASDGSEDPELAAKFGRWEHVSVHAFKPEGRRAGRLIGIGSEPSKGASRTPTWREMCQVKDLFWDGEDVVIQYHPRRSEYVNCHPHTLHLWRPLDATVPTPPAMFVGPVFSEVQR